VSARPSVPRLADEDLDLLISRSLDGDLSPEEASDLEAVLAHDPAAARRKEELARLIAEASALPAPAPPFALATRVNSNVSEKAGRGGSFVHRFGFYPPPGMAVGAMVLLGIVAVAITVLRPAPRMEGPVDVFFTEAATSDAKDASKPVSQGAPRTRTKEAPRSEIAAAAPAAQAPAAQPAVASAASEEMPKDAGKADAQKKPAASESAVNEPAFEAKQRQLAKAEVDADAAPAGRAPAPALSAAAPQAAGAVASGAPRVPGARAISGPARSWSVAVRGDGARRWMLRSAPEGRPLVASTQASAFRVTLDVDGHVTAVRALDASPVLPALLAFVRGLVFAPVGAVADGIARDEKVKAERADAFAERPAEQPSEIDVEVSAR
jgi:hypothetical protein